MYSRTHPGWDEVQDPLFVSENYKTIFYAQKRTKEKILQTAGSVQKISNIVINGSILMNTQ